MFYLHLIHYIGFFGAQTFNSILALLIIKRAGRLFGAYRHVMLVFTLCSMWFSVVEIVTQPVMYIKGSMLVVFIDHGSFTPRIGGLILCLHCSSFAFLISVFAAQFFYRYSVLCRLKTSNLFNGNRIFLIFLPCIAVYLIWFEVVAYGMSASPEKREYLREELKAQFNADSMMVPLVGPYYWSQDSHGRHWRIKDLVTSGMYVVIITIVSSMILFFALKIYFHMKNGSVHLSQKTLDLNRQLFIMLIVQTIVPFVLMYIPIGLILGFPFFGWNLGNYENYASASIAIYPMIEPLIAMYCISDFRKTILRTARIRKHTSRISTIGEETAGKGYGGTSPSTETRAM